MFPVLEMSYWFWVCERLASATFVVSRAGVRAVPRGPRGWSFAPQRTMPVAAAVLCGLGLVWLFGWAFGGVAGVVSFFCSHSFSNHSPCPVWILPFLTSLALSRGALQQVQVRGPCAKSAACGLRIRIVAWTDRLEVQEPNGSASLCGVGETFTLLW